MGELKVVLQPGAFYTDERTGELRCSLVIPGVNDAKPGNVIGLTDDDQKLCSVDNWLKIGAVALYTPPPKPEPKPEPKPKGSSKGGD